MTGTLSTALTFAPVAVALFCVVMTVLNKPMAGPHLLGLLLIELGLLAQVAVAVVLLIRGERPADGMPTFLLYLVGSLLVIPVGVVWGLMDRSRWSSAVVAVACLVVPVLVVRMNQVWFGG